MRKKEEIFLSTVSVDSVSTYLCDSQNQTKTNPPIYIKNAKLGQLFRRPRTLFSGFCPGLKRHQNEQLRKQNKFRLELNLKVPRLVFNMVPKPSKSKRQGEPPAPDKIVTFMLDFEN